MHGAIDITNLNFRARSILWAFVVPSWYSYWLKQCWSVTSFKVTLIRIKLFNWKDFSFWFQSFPFVQLQPFVVRSLHFLCNQTLHEIQSLQNDKKCGKISKDGSKNLLKLLWNDWWKLEWMVVELVSLRMRMGQKDNLSVWKNVANL